MRVSQWGVNGDDGFGRPKICCWLVSIGSFRFGGQESSRSVEGIGPRNVMGPN